MRYLALAADYDGTLAHDGVVNEETIEGLDRLRHSGRSLILVSGRKLEDLKRVFGHFERFHRMVLENGAILYDPATHEEKVLGTAPPPQFVAALKRRGVSPISVGRVIIATSEPNHSAV